MEQQNVLVEESEEKNTGFQSVSDVTTRLLAMVKGASQETQIDEVWNSCNDHLLVKPGETGTAIRMWFIELAKTHATEARLVSKDGCQCRL